MGQTILIEPNSDLNKLLSINLQTYTGSDVIQRDNANDAIALLNILPTIDLIICKHTVEDEKTALLLFNFLDQNDLKIPIIVLGEDQKLTGKVIQVKEPISWEEVIKSSSHLLGVTEDEIRRRIKPNHVPIPIHYFDDIDHTPCDIYIKIQKTAIDTQYVKRLFAQDSFTSEDINKYKKQGLKYFYVSKDYQQYFATFLTSSIIKRLEKNLDIADRLKTTSNAYDIVKHHITKAGVTGEVTDLTEASINSLLIAVKEAPPLAELLKILFSSKISYAYQKAHLVCVIGSSILSKQKWYRPKHLKLITYASFFCDICLKSNTQMQINSENELMTSALNRDEKEAVLTHAMESAKVVSKFNINNDDLITILTEHHGSLEGIGFSDNNLEGISKLSKIFIVADAFVKLMLDPSSPKSKREILTVLYMNFPGDEMQVLIKTLEQKTV